MIRQRIANASGGQIVAAVTIVSIVLVSCLAAIDHVFVERDFRQLQEKRRALAALREGQQTGDPPASTGSTQPTPYVAETKQKAATNARAEICDFAIRATMPDLKPVVGEVIELPLSDGAWNLRQRVRPADPSHPGPASEVDCRINATGEVSSVVKVAQ